MERLTIKIAGIVLERVAGVCPQIQLLTNPYAGLMSYDYHTMMRCSSHHRWFTLSWYPTIQRGDKFVRARLAS
jgi:hypothetical protein